MNANDDDAPSFARARNPDSDTTQVAFHCPKETLMWLDAVSTSRGMDRGPLINEVLGQWAEIQAHRHMVVQRVVAGNQTASDSRQAEARA
jgi:hypothetical protein